MTFKYAGEVAGQVRPVGVTEKDIFNFIVAFYRANTVGPTLEEICLGIDIIQNKTVYKTSKSTILYNIKRLAGKDLLEWPYWNGRHIAGRIIVIGSKWEYEVT